MGENFEMPAHKPDSNSALTPLPNASDNPDRYVRPSCQAGTGFRAWGEVLEGGVVLTGPRSSVGEGQMSAASHLPPCQITEKALQQIVSTSYEEVIRRKEGLLAGLTKTGEKGQISPDASLPPLHISENETQQAEGILTGSISQLASPDAKKMLQQMQSDLLRGNLAGFQNDVKNIEKMHLPGLASYIAEMDKDLTLAHSSTRAEIVQEPGQPGLDKVVVYTNDRLGVEISEEANAPMVRRVEHEANGIVVMTPGTVLAGEGGQPVNADGQFHNIGAETVASINHPGTIERSPDSSSVPPGHECSLSSLELCESSLNPLELPTHIFHRTFPGEVLPSELKKPEIFDNTKKIIDKAS